MLPSEHRLITHVLFFGITTEQWMCHKGTLKSGLQNMHMGWQLSSGCANEVSDACASIDRREDLEVVMIRNDNRMTPEQLRYAAQRMALRLIVHKTRPWVHLFGDLAYLVPVFETERVVVQCSSPEQVVVDRWKHRVQELARPAAA